MQKLSLEKLAPKGNPETAELIKGFAEKSFLIEDSTYSRWKLRFEGIHGFLDGQRSLDVAKLGRELCIDFDDSSIYRVVFALQTYYSLVCELLSSSSLKDSPTEFLKDIASSNDRTFTVALKSIASGDELEKHNIFGAISHFDFDWFAHHIDENLSNKLRDLLFTVSGLWSDRSLIIEYPDPCRLLYEKIMPGNLLHILGEYFTPYWLAELLVSDVDYKHRQKLIDPFAGSGVFLLASLARVMRNNESGISALPYLLAVELNPHSCTAIKTNIILALHEELSGSKEKVFLPVFCADSLTPVFLDEESGRNNNNKSIWIDGKVHDVAKTISNPDLFASTLQYGMKKWSISLDKWISVKPDEQSNDRTDEKTLQKEIVENRSLFEHLLLTAIDKADVLATNPPWVGWEYISRPYRERITPAWKMYSLFTAKGRDASFIKEDLSTLCLVSAWDKYLADNGECVTVISPSAMKSSLAGRTLRRLSIFEDKGFMKLVNIRIFDGIKVFDNAVTDTATWRLVKGKKPKFPVTVTNWSKNKTTPKQLSQKMLPEIRELVTETDYIAVPVNDESNSTWTIGNEFCIKASKNLTGENFYKARTGVFTGGANAVFYVAPENPDDYYDPEIKTAKFRNVIGRAKRKAPRVEMVLEKELVYRVVCGRDINRWKADAGSFILCPHTKGTRMNALPEDTLKTSFPDSLKYLSSMKDVLKKRKGFSGWEKQFFDNSFYAIQRIGEYTFSKYKVAWKYISSDFIVSIIMPDSAGKPVFGNDKVMFIPTDDFGEACYLCGMLSSSPLRWSVTSTMKNTQISTSVIKHLNIPKYEPENTQHKRTSDLCKSGIEQVSHSDFTGALQTLKGIDKEVASLYGLNNRQIQALFNDLMLKYSTPWFT